MSLFENDQYRWRETYFVLFDERQRPSTKETRAALEELGTHYRILDIREDAQGRFDSLTVLAPDDFAAMDISYVVGEDVTAQIKDLSRDMKRMPLTDEERAKLDRLPEFNARFDIYHFEQLVDDDHEEDDDYLDPGALLIVLERLARLCGGVGIDPQSGTLL